MLSELKSSRMGIEPYLLPEDNERSDIAAIAFEIIQLSKHAHPSTSVRDPSKECKKHGEWSARMLM